MTVIISSYGTPNKIEEVDEYVKIIYGKERREVSEDLKRRMRVVGMSPANAIVNEIARKLRDRIKEEVLVGNRNWHPLIDEVIKEVKDEIRFVPLTPFSSKYVLRGYIEALKRAIKETKLKLVSGWYRDYKFQEIWAERVKEGVNSDVIFTAHTLMRGDDYEDQVHCLARGIAKVLNLRNFFVAFHSQPMMEGEWIGPSVFEIVDKVKEAFIVPIGFVFNNLEVMYDLDYELREILRARGIKYRRAKLLDSDDDFIDFLSKVIYEEEYVTNLIV
jgi:ferrochelatase